MGPPNHPAPPTLTRHVSQSRIAGLSSSTKTSAMLAMTCSGTTTMRVVRVLSSMKGWGRGVGWGSVEGRLGVGLE